MLFKLAVFLALSPLLLKADPIWLLYDSDRRIPFFNGQDYERDEYHWWILNTGEPSCLFQNGVFVSEETGTNDIGLIDAWAVTYGGGSIAIVDVDNAHARRVKAIAAKVSGAEVRITKELRLYPENIASGISNSVAVGYKIIVVTTGTGNHLGVSNACRYAESQNAMIFCAVPNAGLDIDITPDYPASWAAEITSIVPVTSTDRDGNLYGPNAAAWGAFVIGAPGRNIIANGTYGSGTSYAAPIVAGCVSLLMQYRPGFAVSIYRDVLWRSSDAAIGIRRINAAALIHSIE